MPIGSQDLKFQRLVSWVRTVARLRRLTLCEVDPGFFYVFESDCPGNRFPLTGAVPLERLKAYLEELERGAGW